MGALSSEEYNALIPWKVDSSAVRGKVRLGEGGFGGGAAEVIGTSIELGAAVCRCHNHARFLKFRVH